MPILFRYLLTLFLDGLLQVGMVFVGLFLLGDGIEQTRRHFHHANFQWQDMALFLLYRLPGFITQLLPAFALLATLLILTRLTRQNEISVLRTSGISIYRILVPFLIGGMLLSGIQYFLQDQVVPNSGRLADALHEKMGQQKPQQAAISLNLWLRDGDYHVSIKQAMLQDNVLLDLSLFRFQDKELVERMDARKAILVNGQWQLQDGRVIRFGESPSLQPFGQKTIDLHLDTQQLDQINPDPSYLTTRELLEISENLRREGYDDAAYRLMFHRKLADPMTTLAAIILAFPFALRLPRAGSGRRSLLVGLLAGFALFVIMDLSRALGMGGRLPPEVAAWWPPLFFVSLGIFLLIHLEENLALAQNFPSLLARKEPKTI